MLCVSINSRSLCVTQYEISSYEKPLTMLIICMCFLQIKFVTFYLWFCYSYAWIKHLFYFPFISFQGFFLQTSAIAACLLYVSTKTQDIKKLNMYDTYSLYWLPFTSKINCMLQFALLFSAVTECTKYISHILCLMSI